MPLLQSPQTRAAADIRRLAQYTYGDLAAAAARMNAITCIMLSLDDAGLAGFCNALGPAALATMLARHARGGAALNVVLADTADTLRDDGDAAAQTPVDVSPLSDKLAKQWRKLDFDGTTFSVAQLPRPEPPSQPQPEEPTE